MSPLSRRIRSITSQKAPTTFLARTVESAYELRTQGGLHAVKEGAAALFGLWAIRGT